MNSMRTLYVLQAAAPIVLAVLASACSGPQATKPKMKETPYRKIVSLSPSTTEVLDAASTPFLMGRSMACNYPPNVSKISVFTTIDAKPDYEKLQLAKPDLIVYDKALYSDDAIAKLKGLGFKTFEYNPHTVKEYEEQSAAIAAFSLQEIPHWQKLDELHATVNEFKDAPEPRPTVAIIVPSKEGNLIAATKSFQADLVRCVGGRLVGPDGDKFVPINPEELIKLNPKYVVTAGDSAPFESDPRFASLDAVKNHKITAFDQDVVERAGARVNLFAKNLRRAITK